MLDKTLMKIGVALVVILLASLGFYAYYGGNSSDSAEVSTSVISPAPNNDSGATTAVKSGVQVATSASKLTAPSLDRAVVFPSSFSAKAKTETQNRMHDLIASLRADNTSFSNWVELGLYYRSVEDYKGAEAAWKFASLLEPKNSLAYGNLGILYKTNLINYKLSEQNFLKAIQNDPKQTYLYFQVVELYVRDLNNPSAAKVIVAQGIKSNPKSQELKVLRSSLGA